MTNKSTTINFKDFVNLKYTYRLLEDDLKLFKKDSNGRNEAILGRDFTIATPLAYKLTNTIDNPIINANKNWVKAEHQPHLFKHSKAFNEYMNKAINCMSCQIN